MGQTVINVSQKVIFWGLIAISISSTLLVIAAQYDLIDLNDGVVMWASLIGAPGLLILTMVTIIVGIIAALIGMFF